MSDPIAAGRAEAVIDRPADVVRAHFFDLDHSIRARVHHGVELRWLPPESAGELRFEHATSALGRRHADVLVLEEGEDGACVKRFVGGPNVGSKLVASFFPLDEGKRTRVLYTAYTPKEGYRTGIGKLSSIGIEKLLQKSLEEHRRALDGYQPGHAQGAVRAVITGLRERVMKARAEHREDTRALMTNLLEAACAVAVADGKADDAEREVIGEVARTLSFVELDAPAIDRMVANVAAAIVTDGIERRCEKIAARLASLGLGEVGLGVAALVADVSHGIGLEERATLLCLARALGVDEPALDRLVRETDARLSRP